MRKIRLSLLAAGLALVSAAAVAHPYVGFGYGYAPEVVVAPAPVVAAPIVEPYPGYVPTTTIYTAAPPAVATTYVAPAYAAPVYAAPYAEPGLVVAPVLGLRLH
jgi:hypothetical protein